MTANNHDRSSVSRWFSLGLPERATITIWFSVIMVLLMSTVNILGWIFDITLFKNYVPSWKHMRAITAVSFLLLALSLSAIQVHGKFKSKRLLIFISASIIVAIGLLTILSHIPGFRQSFENAEWPFLFLSSGSRMSLLSGIIFVFFGLIIFLILKDNEYTTDWAHILILPVLMASYYVPVSYILNVYPLVSSPDLPVSLISGISFTLMGLVVILIRPHTWLMKVFTTHNMGGIMARKLIPAMLILPIVIGWMRIKGERMEIFESEIGVVLVALVYSIFFIFFIWLAARSVNAIDVKRREADEALKRAYDDLETRVKDRTKELTELNMLLDAEIAERKKTEEKLKEFNRELENIVSERTRELEEANSRLFRELTERILTGEALKQSEVKLLELNATKDKFFNIVAHDLKNPFTSLIGASELLLEDAGKLDTDNVYTLAAIINDSAKNGFAILQNLLDWSRSQTGLLKINPEQINIKELIDESIATLAQVSANKDINLVSEVKENLYITTDKNMIRTVLRNLLSNAIKFSYRKGKVIVSNNVSGNELIVKVKDFGVGIKKENIEKLFRIETKFSVPGTENEQGTSIGLKLCKEFIEKLNGRIWVESTEKKGSEFMFSLPLDDSES
ncbi:MAG TPA: ATP-binding protein [Bacteroidales bacterium]|nr:ATP-binding protein [Bacteroidales bacterium]